MEVDTHFQVLLNISFGVPSKGALLQGPLHGIPRREMPHRTLIPIEKVAGWPPELGLMLWRGEKFPTPAMNQTTIP